MRRLLSRWFALVMYVALPVFTTRLPAQTPAYYVQHSDGSISPVERGDPHEVHVLYWRALFYKVGQARGGANKPWGSTEADTPEELAAEIRRSQRVEVAGCKALDKIAPCDATTHFNFVSPVAVLDESREKRAPGVSEETFPGSDATNRAVLSRALDQWAKQLQNARNRLVRLEMRGGATSPNPYSGIGSTLREYRDLLKEAEDRYHQIRNLSERVTQQFDAQQQREIENDHLAIDRDMRRLDAIAVASGVDASSDGVSSKLPVEGVRPGDAAAQRRRESTAQQSADEAARQSQVLEQQQKSFDEESKRRNAQRDTLALMDAEFEAKIADLQRKQEDEQKTIADRQLKAMMGAAAPPTADADKLASGMDLSNLGDSTMRKTTLATGMMIALGGSATNAALAQAGCAHWAVATYHPTGWGSQHMFVQTYGQATVVNQSGEPTNTGDFLEITNSSRKFPLYYGLSGVVNSEVPPTQSRRVSLGQSRSRNDTRTTQVSLLVRWCDKETSR